MDLPPQEHLLQLLRAVQLMRTYTDQPRNKALPTKYVGGAGHYPKRGAQKPKEKK